MDLNINSEKFEEIREEGILQTETRNNSNLSSVQKYEIEWQDLSAIAKDPNLKILRRVAVSGDLKISKFRSVCWSLLLNVISGDSKQWISQKHNDRLEYKQMKSNYCINPHKIDDINDDPLSQSRASIWNQYFRDNEFRAIIKQDVVRTFPGVEFYRKPSIQEVMINILFCYGRKYPEMSYRQGMHEVLAPILFVLHCDHQALKHIREMNKTIDKTLDEVLDPIYLEEDAFCLFSKIMRKIESYYQVCNPIAKSPDNFPDSPRTLQQDLKRISELEVISQLKYIKDKILIKEDLHLHNHLAKLDIPLPIFGIRWLRLLFGREFALQDLLILWDAIFGEDNAFGLIDYIVVAMLIRIRDKLLLGDYTVCLTYLMKYPTNADVSLIIRHALHMKTPSIYPLSNGAFVYITSQQQQQQQQHQQLKYNNIKFKKIGSQQLLRNIIETPKRFGQQQNDRNNCAFKDLRNDDLQAKVNGIQKSAALQSIKYAKETQSIDDDPGIVDGYLENSFDILRLEIQNAHSIMKVSGDKLTIYLSVLRKYFSRSTSDDVQQALDGIEQICALLTHKSFVPYPIVCPVEPAFEANEHHQQHQQQQLSKTNEQKDNKQIIKQEEEKHPIVVASSSSVIKQSTSASSLDRQRQQQGELRKFRLTDHESKQTFIRNLKYSNECYEYQGVEDQTIRNHPILIQSWYEIPEYEMSRRSVENILGDRKDFEMHEFYTKSSDNNNHDNVANFSILDNSYFNKLPNPDVTGERMSPMLWDDDDNDN